MKASTKSKRVCSTVYCSFRSWLAVSVTAMTPPCTPTRSTACSVLVHLHEGLFLKARYTFLSSMLLLSFRGTLLVNHIGHLMSQMCSWRHAIHRAATIDSQLPETKLEPKLHEPKWPRETDAQWFYRRPTFAKRGKDSAGNCCTRSCGNNLTKVLENQNFAQGLLFHSFMRRTNLITWPASSKTQRTSCTRSVGAKPPRLSLFQKFRQRNIKIVLKSLSLHLEKTRHLDSEFKKY